jgi:hypothetical protein
MDTRGAGVTAVMSSDQPEPAPSPILSVMDEVARLPEGNTAYPDTTFAPPDEPSARHSRIVAVVQAASAVELLVGVWLAASPWFVGSGGSGVLRWNNVAVGVVLAVLAAARFVRPSLPRTPSVSFGLGAWTVVAAFVLSFQNGATGTAPLWNAIGCAAALTAAAAWSTTETERATLRQG